MQSIVHAELAWLLAQGLERRRDRILVTAAGVLPDLDALALLAGERGYGLYHHVVTHNFLAAGTVALAAFAFARRRLPAAGLAFAAFHLHLFCDLAGSGPGWPVCYLWPFDDQEWFWGGQWDLASWQNGLIGLAASLACLATAFPLRRTFVEVFSSRADAAVIKALWQRFRPGFEIPAPR